MRTPTLVSGGRAVAAHNRLRSFDSGRNSGRAFDSAGSSGFNFLQSQLELIDPKVIEPLQSSTHARDITVKTGGGFPEFVSAWAANYASTGTGSYGLQGTNNTEIPQAQVDIQKGLWPTYIWTSGFTITYVDLERMKTAKENGQPAPFSLQDLYEKSVRTVWNKALDFVTYNGFLGGAGLVNNPNSPAVVVPNGGTGTSWATKTPTQILNDVNLAINQTVMNSGYDTSAGMADTMLLPYGQFAQLSQPMTIGGVGYDSILSYIKRNSVATHNGVDFKIFPLPNPWISGQGLGATDRAIVYRNEEENLLLRVPTPMQKGMTVPTTKDGGAYETMFVGCISSVVFKRTTTMIYLDGI